MPTLLSVALLGAGCSLEDSTIGSSEGPWPLTGLAGYSNDDERQVVTVKIENTSAGQPQLGVDSADLVIQELVEGGLTRLAAMFHSQYPPQAGPVRSLRETDIGLVLPTGGTLAASGGAASTVATVEGAGVPTVEEGDPAFSRDSSRPSPYNLILDVATLGASLPASRPPGPYLPFGEVSQDAPGKDATRVDLGWPAEQTTFDVDTDTGLWLRSDIAGYSGGLFTNVIALTLPVTFAGKDAAGTPIPTMHTEGSGAGVVLTGGKAYEVRWSKASAAATWEFAFKPDGSDTSSEEFEIPAGRTWLALLPEDGGSVVHSLPDIDTEDG